MLAPTGIPVPDTAIPTEREDVEAVVTVVELLVTQERVEDAPAARKPGLINPVPSVTLLANAGSAVPDCVITVLLFILKSPILSYYI